MLIESFAEDLAKIELDPSLGQYLLIDGAFVPGLHRKIDDDRKAILFESLPGCSDEARDLSPFVTPFDPGDKAQARLLRRCNRWPMVSLIKTRENIKALSERLSAWCVVEADGQNFNFRFADTRRLPAIYETLNRQQRAQFAGPAVRWTYLARDGHWRSLQLDGPGTEIADNPTLDQEQFASLVDDSQADELLAVLRNRGHEVYPHPSRSHALLDVALRVAIAAKLDDDDLVGWCASFWKKDQLHDDSTARAMLDAWRADSI